MRVENDMPPKPQKGINNQILTPFYTHNGIFNFLSTEPSASKFKGHM